MNKHILIGSIIAVAIIVLSSFSSVVGKVSSDDELVEITTEFCGIDGIEPYTIKMSEHDCQEFKEYLNEFKRRIDAVSTPKEGIEIYNEAIVELDKFGLLGKLSIEKAMKLVNGGYLNFKSTKMLDERYLPNQEESEDINNYLCLVSGQATLMEIQSIRSIIKMFNLFLFLLIIELLSTGVPHNSLLWDIFLFLLERAENHYYNSKIKQKIVFGADVFFYGGDGWVNTIGLNGIKNINGSFYGKTQIYFQLMRIIRYYFFGDEGRGIMSFTGLKFCIDEDSWESFFIGSALLVSLGPVEEI